MEECFDCLTVLRAGTDFVAITLDLFLLHRLIIPSPASDSPSHRRLAAQRRADARHPDGRIARSIDGWHVRVTARTSAGSRCHRGMAGEGVAQVVYAQFAKI